LLLEYYTDAHDTLIAAAMNSTGEGPPKRRFAPVPIETTYESVRKPAQAQPGGYMPELTPSGGGGEGREEVVEGLQVSWEEKMDDNGRRSVEVTRTASARYLPESQGQGIALER